MSEKDKVSEVKKMDSMKKAVCILMAVMLLILGGIVAYGVYLLNLINRIEDDGQISDLDMALLGDEMMPEDFTGEMLSADDVQIADEAADVIAVENNVNILLVGQDLAAGGVRGRSDAMILCTFNKENKTLTMTSFLRDMYVQIPEHFPHKFNTAYALGGFSLLDNTLKHNFGIQVDGNVGVDFSSFEDIVNLLGGVTLEFTAAEVEYMNSACGFNLVVGSNHVDGLTALAYSRIRHLDSDFGRTNRQRTVLLALVEQYSNLKTMEILELMEKILPMISTDLSNTEILGYALEMIPLLADCTITTQHIPADGTYGYSWVDGMSVLAVNLKANQQILHDTLGE